MWPERPVRGEPVVPESKRHPARRPQRRPAKPGHRSPAPAPPPAPARGFRGWLERWSVGPLTFLTTLPSFVVPAALALLLVGGLALPQSWTGLLLIVPALFLAWLAALSWPRTSPLGRLVRVLAVVALLLATVARLLGRF
jgi:hypothetical protein